MFTICCILIPRVLSSFLSWKNLLWEKQKVANSKLNGTACNKLRQFVCRIWCFSSSEWSSLWTMSLQAWRSKISTPGLFMFMFLHSLSLSPSSLSLLSPQICLASKNGWLQLSHNFGADELLLVVQLFLVFLILNLGTNLWGDKVLEARQRQGTVRQTQMLLVLSL